MSAPSSAAPSPSPSPSSLRPWHLAGGLLATAVLGLALYGLWPVLTGQAQDETAREDVEAPSSEAAVTAVVAERVDFPLRTQASGRLTPWQEARLHVEADGPVIERTVEEGDRVEAGDLLARVQNEEERIALKEARANLLEARAEYQAKYANDDAGLPVRDTANSGPARQNDQRGATQAAVSGLTGARQAVERAELNLSRTRVTAPFAGRVAEVAVEEGQYVSGGAGVATLLREDRMKVEVDVLASDVVHVEQDATARVHVPALGPATDSTAWVQGRVWSVNPMVDRDAGTGRVTIAVPNPDSRLVAGLYAEAHIETRRLPDRLVVPDEAVLVRQGRDLIFVVEGGRAQWTYVDVGARSGDYAEITDGVTPGDTVVVDGHFALAHDAPVEVDDVRELRLE